MSHIYFEKPEIPRPEKSYINKTKGDVFIFIPKPGERLTNKTKRVVIGHAEGEYMMHPNENFREMYPNLWAKYYEEEVKSKEQVLNAGLYELLLGIGYQTGLYPSLQSVFGPLYGNAFMDLAMFLNRIKTDAMMTFRQSMNRQIVFSKDRFSDDWIYDFLSNKVSNNDCMRFMDMWIDMCVKNGETDVWISLERTDSDCFEKELSIHSKTKRDDKNIVTYAYIISAKSGLPLAMTAVNGVMADAIHLAKTHGLNIKGVLIDRECCEADILTEIEKSGYTYVIMLKSNTLGHVEMYNEYANEIRWNLDHMVESPNGTLFGCTSETPRKMFKTSDNEAYINLFFDGLNSAERSSSLVKRIMATKKSIDRAIAKGQKPVLSPTMSRYIRLHTDKDGLTTASYRLDKWQEDISTKGFYSIATSENLGLAEANRLYKIRSCSEEIYSENKSQLRFTVPKNPEGKGALAKLFVGFVSSIVRFYIMDACHRLEYDTDTMVTEMDSIHLRLNGAVGDYLPVHDESIRHLSMLGQFSVEASDLDSIAADVNSRENTITSQTRKLKSYEDKQKIEAKMLERESDEPRVKRKRGRPKGSKNAATLEREAKIAAGIIKPKEKGKPGRPKGAKNKATLEREAKKAAGIIKPKEKRKAGRPKGSRNKVNVLLTLKYRKGRPPGSKNKKTLEREEQARQQTALQVTEPTQKPEVTTTKGKAGRPFGSKDKNPSDKRKGRVPGSRNKTAKALDEILAQMGDDYGQKKP